MYHHTNSALMDVLVKPFTVLKGVFIKGGRADSSKGEGSRNRANIPDVQGPLTGQNPPTVDESRWVRVPLANQPSVQDEQSHGPTGNSSPATSLATSTESHVNTAMPSPPASDHVSSSSVVSMVREIDVEIRQRSVLLDRLQTARIDAKYKRSELEVGMRFLRDAVRQMSEARHAGPAERPTVDPPRTLDEISRDTLRVIDAVEERLVRVTASEGAVQALERQVAGPEGRISALIQTFLATVPGLATERESAAPVPDDDDHDDVRRAPRPNLTPDLVRRFYDAAGEVGIAQERLANAFYGHTEDLTDREYLRDQDEELECSDEEFEQRFRDRVEQLERDLEIAQDEADRLETQCRDNGFAVKSARREYPTEIITSVGGDEDGSVVNSSEISPVDHPSFPMNGKSSFFDSVMQWDDVGKGGVEGEGSG